MSNMIISVDFMAGTMVSDAVRESKEKARYLNVAYIKFKFNNTDFRIGPCADVEKAVEQYPKSKHIYEF